MKASLDVELIFMPRCRGNQHYGCYDGGAYFVLCRYTVFVVIESILII